MVLLAVWIAEKAIQFLLGLVLVGIVWLPLWLLGVLESARLLALGGSCAGVCLWGLWEGCGLVFLGGIALTIQAAVLSEEPQTAEGGE